MTAAPAVAVPAAEDTSLFTITSPMVGTFYAAPSPDSENYVKPGSKVTPESTVCIVEAMKIMNEIKAEVNGTIEQVCVKNGQPVEFGQALCKVRLD
jgi:acetyl-CoA carboxylase biotin carboxyl carrier protein